MFLPPTADMGRNMIVMLRGYKRYLLLPPADCPLIYHNMDPVHPEYRHSQVGAVVLQ